MEVDILFTDNHFIEVNKKNSQLVQGDATGDLSLDKWLKEYLRETCRKPGNVFLGVIHRLDRPVSGVVIFARTGKGLARMNKVFKDHIIVKKYWAIVQERPPKESDTLTHYLLRDHKKNKSFVYDKPQPGTKEASLSYRLAGASHNYFFLEVELHTGRHHQIRSQLACIGCIIKGDLKYGARRSNPGGGISLHARSLEFVHPIKGEPVKLLASPPPEPLWHAFEKVMR